MTQYAPPILPDPDQSTFLRDLIQEIASWALNLKAILEGGISFDDNVDCSFFEVTANSSAEFSAQHEFGKTPQMYVVVGQDGPGTLYDGDSAWTNSTIFFRSDTDGTTFRVMVL